MATTASTEVSVPHCTMTKVSPNPKNNTAKESIHIHIKNEEQSFTVETLPEESIAAVKVLIISTVR